MRIINYIYGFQLKLTVMYFYNYVSGENFKYNQNLLQISIDELQIKKIILNCEEAYIKLSIIVLFKNVLFLKRMVFEPYIYTYFDIASY